MEMKVSMTLWLDGSRWLWPLVESELWYNTRLLEDTAEASDAAGCHPRPPTPPQLPVPRGAQIGEARPPQGHAFALSRLWGHPVSDLRTFWWEHWRSPGQVVWCGVMCVSSVRLNHTLVWALLGTYFADMVNT